MPEPRYFVDERSGCIAVRDRENTDPDYPGLHYDTTGVVKYWHGKIVHGGTCGECGREMPSKLAVSTHDQAQAILLCAELNAAAEKAAVL